MSQVLKSKKGYKEVELGLRFLKLIIPIDWDLRSLNEFTSDIKGGSPLTPSDFTETGFPVLHKGDIKYNDRVEIGITNPFCSEEFALKNKDSIIDDSFLLVTLRDIVPSGPAIGLIVHSKGKFLLAQGAYGFHVDKKNIDSRYLVHISNSGFYRRYMKSIAVGSTQIHIRTPLFFKIKLALPKFTEQQKIATILSNTDNLISNTQKIIDQTKSIKKGLMQKLLTKGIGHKKFKKVKWLFGKEIKIPEEWISKKVGDVFKLKSGSTPSRTKSEFFEGDISWITSTDLNRSKITSTIEKITKEAVKDANLTLLPKGTFVIATYGLEADGTRGKCGILEMNATCNQACMAFLHSSVMDSLFLFYFYLYFGEKIIFSIAQGTKQQNLYSYTINKVTLLIPPLKEQLKIISILSHIDSQITTQTQYKEKLERLKKSLMQKLLTGEVRVTV